MHCVINTTFFLISGQTKQSNSKKHLNFQEKHLYFYIKWFFYRSDCPKYWKTCKRSFLIQMGQWNKTIILWEMNLTFPHWKHSALQQSFRRCTIHTFTQFQKAYSVYACIGSHWSIQFFVLSILRTERDKRLNLYQTGKICRNYSKD